MKNFNSFAMVIILAVLAALIVTACNQPDAAAKPDNVDYYTCTMHPSVRSQDPKGKCPICSMDLVPVMKKGAEPVPAGKDEAPSQFTVPVSRQQQIGVTYAVIARQPLRHPVRAGGMVASDKQREAPVVWVWAQFYQDELPMLKKGLPATITSSSYPGEKFDGKISEIEPFINEASRTGRVRIDVDNSGRKLWPGMYVDAELTMDMGDCVAVPEGAVLPTGKHNIVFVDKGEGKLEPRYIELGVQCGNYWEAKSGLKEGERVVTSANFLIDAEAKVQGALKSW